MEPTYDKPLPVADPLAQPYWDALKAHRLSVQRCRLCGDRHFPPLPACPRCLTEDQEWETVSGRATLVSWARFHRAYWPGFQDALPYDVCIVQLDEGPLVVSNFSGEPPGAWRTGMPMQVVFDDVTAALTLPRFAAASVQGRTT